LTYAKLVASGVGVVGWYTFKFASHFR
jgi:hypothetical protein